MNEPTGPDGPGHDGRGMGVPGGDSGGVGPADGGVQIERIIPKKKRRSPRSRTPDAWEIKRAERTAEVMALRKDGKDIAEIAELVDLSGPTVAKIIRETVPKVYLGEAEAFMELTMKRQEALLAAVWRNALNGDLEAVEQARKVIADMRTLTGIDAPKRQELTGKDGGPLEIAAAGERIEQRLADMAKRLKQGEDIQVRVLQEAVLDDTKEDEGAEDEREG